MCEVFVPEYLNSVLYCIGVYIYVECMFMWGIRRWQKATKHQANMAKVWDHLDLFSGNLSNAVSRVRPWFYLSREEGCRPILLRKGQRATLTDQPMAVSILVTKYSSSSCGDLICRESHRV